MIKSNIFLNNQDRHLMLGQDCQFIIWTFKICPPPRWGKNLNKWSFWDLFMRWGWWGTPPLIRTSVIWLLISCVLFRASLETCEFNIRRFGNISAILISYPPLWFHIHQFDFISAVLVLYPPFWFWSQIRHFDFISSILIFKEQLIDLFFSYTPFWFFTIIFIWEWLKMFTCLRSPKYRLTNGSFLSMLPKRQGRPEQID